MPRRFQFSLKLLFIVTTVLAVWLGSVVNRAERQRKVIAAVERLGGEIGYDYQYNSAGDEIPAAGMPGPSWLHRLIGDDYFRSVCFISVEGVTDEQLSWFDDCDTLCGLSITSDSVTDSLIPRLVRLKRLKWLGLDSNHVTVDGLQRLSALPELEWLMVCETSLPNDAAANSQKAIPRCEIDLMPSSWHLLLQGGRLKSLDPLKKPLSQNR